MGAGGLLVPASPSDDMTPTLGSAFCLSNKSNTLPLATRYNIKCVGLSPDGRLAIIVDEGDAFSPEMRQWCRVVTGGTGWGVGMGVRVTRGRLQILLGPHPVAPMSGALVCRRGGGWTCLGSSLAVCPGPQAGAGLCVVGGWGRFPELCCYTGRRTSMHLSCVGRMAITTLLPFCRGRRAAGQPGVQVRAAPLPLQGLCAQRLLLP